MPVRSPWRPICHIQHAERNHFSAGNLCQSIRLCDGLSKWIAVWWSTSLSSSATKWHTPEASFPSFRSETVHEGIGEIPGRSDTCHCDGASGGLRRCPSVSGRSPARTRAIPALRLWTTPHKRPYHYVHADPYPARAALHVCPSQGDRAHDSVPAVELGVGLESLLRSRCAPFDHSIKAAKFHVDRKWQTAFHCGYDDWHSPNSFYKNCRAWQANSDGLIFGWVTVCRRSRNRGCVRLRNSRQPDRLRGVRSCARSSVG